MLKCVIELNPSWMICARGDIEWIVVIIVESVYVAVLSVKMYLSTFSNISWYGFTAQWKLCDVIGSKFSCDTGVLNGRRLALDEVENGVRST